MRAGAEGGEEDEMVRWHHQFNGHEFEQTPGDSEGQGRLACCCPWCRRVRHSLVTEKQQPNMWGLLKGFISVIEKIKRAFSLHIEVNFEYTYDPTGYLSSFLISR